ncbi:MAG: PPC domain-containing protein [Limisphaerales bacterium]
MNEKYERGLARRGKRVLLALGVLLCAAVEAWAVAPHLASVLPTGGQRGTQVELSFHGDRLQDTEEIVSYEPGLEILKLGPVTNHIVKAQVKIAPDCNLGEHHLRVRTATGLSELRTFFVGPYRVIAEKEPNNDPAAAQPIALNTTVTGVITSEDVDCFAVEVRQGDRLSAEVEGMRLGRGMFDPRLTALDSHGAVLADVDDTQLALQDPFVSLVAPVDGTYILRLREATYGGNDDCHYRLHIGAFPRPTAVYPLGGKAGETVTLAFSSEATGQFTQPVKLPPTPKEKFGVFAELDGLLAPSPNWIRVSDFPNALEAPPNQDREHATVADLPPPLALNGVISQMGEEDWFRFKAPKGEALELSVFARRLGSPLDSALEVFDAKGQSLAANDDAVGADSSLKFTPPETTNYFVRIRDTLGHGGHDYVYRVEVVPVAPHLEVKIPEVARNDTQARQYIAVPRGNRFATLISAKRANFGGELVFGSDGLPPGVTLQADRMAANVDAMPLVFEAAPDAAIGGKLLDLTATWTNGTSKVTGTFHQDIEMVQGPNNTTYYGTSVDKLWVVVTREAPFKLAIVDPKVPLVQAGSMRLEIAAERAPGFDEPIEVQMVWNPPGVSSQPEATIPKGATNVFYQLNAGGGAELRSWKIAVLGHATVAGGQLFVSSQLADLEVAAPFVTGKIETLWVNPGKQGKLTVNLELTKPFEGAATIRLCGLPEKVSAAAQTITKDSQEVVFDLAVDANCPAGSYRNLFCALDVPQNGRVIAHTIAQGGILRVVPPKKAEAAVAAVAQTKKR